MRFCLSSRRRHTSWPRDWSSDVCSSDLLVELHRERIRHARVVGNPGCYPVTVLLGLAPLLQQDTPLIDTSNIIADCKSGVSGAGRKASIGTLLDRKSTRLNSSHVAISYAVFCLK